VTRKGSSWLTGLGGRPGLQRGKCAAPPNNEMNLTKPAQAMKLRRLSQCWADLRRGRAYG
jgi:hypothetical protein